MRSASHRWAVAALVALFVTGGLFAAPGAPGSSEPKKDLTPAEKIKKALEEITDVSIENQPLELAFQQLGEQTKINFVVDRFTLQQYVGDPGSMVVNTTLKGAKMRSALRTILSQHNLGYAIIGDTVVITTEEMAMHRQMRQRVTVDVEKQPVEKALKQLSRDTGTNLLLDSRVTEKAQAPVTLQVEDVPLETAAKLLAHMSGLRTVRVGNVLFVTTKETADEMRQDGDLTGPQPGGPGGIPRIDFGFAVPPGAGGGIAPLVLPVPAQPPQPAPNPPDAPKEDKPPEQPKPEEKPKDR